MLFAEASPAKTSRAPASRRELTAIDPGYGQKSSDLLASFDPKSFSWRTSQRCWLATAGSGLAEFSGTWPRSGMMQSGIAYQLPALAPLTSGTGSGSSLIPTPTACDWKGSGVPREHRGPNNNLRDWFKWHFNMQYPPVAVVEYMMGFPEGHTDLRPSETP
jgi:hypothetical protein